jgi:hypothetical protein
MTFGKPQHETLPENIESSLQYWVRMRNGVLPDLARFMISILTILPTSVICEQMFSIFNGTTGITRQLMGDNTLESITRISALKEPIQEPEAQAKATKRSLKNFDLVQGRSMIKKPKTAAVQPVQSEALNVYTSVPVRRDVKRKKSRDKEKKKIKRAAERRAQAAKRGL